MYEFPLKKCGSPRCAGLLSAALLLMAATPGFCGEMEKIASSFKLYTVVEDSGPETLDVDCFCWPANNSDGLPQELELGVNESLSVTLPRYNDLWVGLTSDAPEAWWQLEVLSSPWFATKSDTWYTNEHWPVDPGIPNLIAMDEGGWVNLKSSDGKLVPESISLNLEEVDGSLAHELKVRLQSNPSGRAGCRMIVFAKGRMTDE